MKWVFGYLMAGIGVLVLASVFVSAERSLKHDFLSNIWTPEEGDSNYFTNIVNFLWQKSRLGYQHVWPEMEFGWRIVVGTIIGFFGAAFGSVGGVGGGGIYVPMLTLIIGFDTKSSTAISKCMIMGAAAASVLYNLKLRHPTLDLPIIDYDLALLFQPMLVLGISIGVAFNVMFADWMVTVLLIIIFLGTSTKAFFKGVEVWKKETISKEEVARRLTSNGIGSEEVEYKPLPGSPSNGFKMESKESKTSKVSIIENVYWKELGILVAVWVIILALQLAKNYTTTCSATYWVLDLLQIPVAVGASAYEAISLYQGRRVILSKGETGTNWQLHQLVLYCSCGILAGVVGGLLGLGGGFILGPLFLELGIPPQVSSATATFAMLFSSSMSVVEYYLLKRFPVPYGQHVVRKIITILGRASLIIFILAFTIFASAISLGGFGIIDMIEKIEAKEYMGFDSICA
ncbi:sulfite exporter TauE/SafE family protein 3-like isoform X2 [Cornus florida]|uniref:sulfite exporter TauE/SafE family protein 3-like isoform X2 n=1 Tax=Cornus florida TaxID=4283 RepID=UPI00289D54D1|nr:sulfite exporter TauE/SafE family protein 3-like isoform X2 [Cornus florida]